MKLITFTARLHFLCTSASLLVVWWCTEICILTQSINSCSIWFYGVLLDLLSLALWQDVWDSDTDTLISLGCSSGFFDQVQLWLATTSSQFHRNFHFKWKKKVALSQYHKRGSMFSSSLSFEQQLLQQTLKCPVFVLASLTSPSSAGEGQQELGSWFCPLNLQLPSGTALGEIARWQAGAQTWTQTWTKGL